MGKKKGRFVRPLWNGVLYWVFYYLLGCVNDQIGHPVNVIFIIAISENAIITSVLVWLRTN